MWKKVSDQVYGCCKNILPTLDSSARFVEFFCSWTTEIDIILLVKNTLSYC